MADFDKWQKALGDAGTLRVQQGTAQSQLNAASIERDRLFLTTRQDQPAFRSAQAQVEAKLREVESFAPRIQAADAEAAREEPSQEVKRNRYCTDAARARATGKTAATQMVLDNRCRNEGGNPTAAVAIANTSAPAPTPASPAARNLLPIAAVVALAVLGGAYLWSQQAKAATASRR